MRNSIATPTTTEPGSLTPLFSHLVINRDERIEYTDGDHGAKASAWMPLLVVRLAWDAGLDLDDLADGFGPGAGTMGDWSAIRDSSMPAIGRMLERSLNFVAERLDVPRAEHGRDAEGKLTWTRIVRPSQRATK